jgi:hypothetical protein
LLGLQRPLPGRGVLYALGWYFLRRALARDPGAAMLRSFTCTRVAAVLGIATLFLLQVVGTSSSGLFAPVALVAMGCAFFALWSSVDSVQGLTRTMGSGLLLCGSLCFIAGTGEIAFRLPFVVARTGGNVPGMRRWAQENYDRLWEKNPLGLRSFHLDHPKPQGALRVIVVGDSFTWGDKVADIRDTWPYVLEQNLNRSGATVEVISLATPGYTTVNEAEAL